MKVLMVISQFYPIIGGAEKQAQLLAEMLIEKGINVSIVTGWWVWGTRRREKIDGVPIFRNFSFWRMFGIPGLRTLGVFMYMITLGIYLYTHREVYQLIHVHQALYPTFAATFVGKKILKKPVLVKAASSGMTGDIHLWRQFPLGRLQLSYLLKKMDCLVTVSKAGGDEFREAGFPDSKIIHIPNGVKFPKDAKNNYHRIVQVITTTRLSYEKGIDILLRAWASILNDRKGLKLTIIGGGHMNSELRRLSEHLGVEESVVFTGPVFDIRGYLEKADLFVLPSRTEGVSNALLEAMSHGIPCVATKVGGTSDVLGHEGDHKIPRGYYFQSENGILVNPDDVEGLSRALVYLIGNEKTREELGRRGRAHIQRGYDIRLIADRYITLYERLIQEKG
jgi:glycosyltransferase involved in cell wall biosynthesis